MFAKSEYPNLSGATVLELPIGVGSAANLMIVQPVAIIYGLSTEED